MKAEKSKILNTFSLINILSLFYVYYAKPHDEFIKLFFGYEIITITIFSLIVLADKNITVKCFDKILSYIVIGVIFFMVVRYLMNFETEVMELIDIIKVERERIAAYKVYSMLNYKKINYFLLCMVNEALNFRIKE